MLLERFDCSLNVYLFLVAANAIVVIFKSHDKHEMFSHWSPDHEFHSLIP